jgi:hypothetical protein
MKMDTNKVEKALLDRELKTITDKLGKIGGEIKAVFDKYGVMQGDHVKELHDYIVKNITAAGSSYYAGYTTAPRTNTHPDRIPECIKEIILKWAVKDFFDNFQDMREIVDSIEQ